MLRVLTNLVRKAYGEPPLIRDLETWAKDTAKLATPDDLIAASIIQSFAKDFDGWEASGFDIENVWSYTEGIVSKVPATLINKRRDIAVRWDACIEKKNFGNMIVVPRFRRSLSSRASVNGTLLDSTNSSWLSDSWHTLAEQHKQAKEAARKAKADMEANESKWNLAEKLLGMKRNEFGALVPVETAS